MTAPMVKVESEKLGLLDLFSGIGGVSLGLERSGGFETRAFCEIEPFCRRVLAKHWPKVICYNDVRELTRARLDADGIVVDAISAGFPCQDVSQAGRRVGINGERSGLWGHVVRLTDELRPRVLYVENVANLLAGERGAWFGRVLGDMAEIGYDAEWHCIPAAYVGAPHIRDRVWLVAYPQHSNAYGVGQDRPPRDLWAAELRDQQGSNTEPLCRHVSDADEGDGVGRHRDVQVGWGWFASQTAQDGVTGGAEWRSEPGMGRVAHGISDRLDRVGALGNAVVPQIPELVGRAILASLDARRTA